MKKLVSLVMVVIMLSALCATAMADEEVYSCDGRWLGTGYMVISEGKITWLKGNGVLCTGQIYEVVRKDFEEVKDYLPIIAVLSEPNFEYSAATVYMVSIEGDTLKLERVHGRYPFTTNEYTFTKQ